MTYFEVEVTGTSTEVYLVKANSEEEAQANWDRGEQLGIVVVDQTAGKVVEAFDQDPIDPDWYDED